jgi:hypothetical protein
VAPEEIMGAPPGDFPGCAQWAGHTSCSECSPQVVEIQEHDLCNNSHQDFWTTWSATTARFCSVIESEATGLMKIKGKVNGSWTKGTKQTFASVEVLINLYLKKGSHDELLTSFNGMVK